MRPRLVVGGVPGATTNLSSPVTWYVPLPVEAPPLANVCHVPPPVTSSGFPGFERNVPEPVSVIFEPSLARADATPPAVTGCGVTLKSTLMMSHRTFCSSVDASALAEIPLTFEAAGADVGLAFSQARASPITATPVSPAPSRRVFIVPPCLGERERGKPRYRLVQRRTNWR